MSLVQKLLSVTHLSASISIEIAIRKYKIRNNKDDPSVTEKITVGCKKRILANSKGMLGFVGVDDNKKYYEVVCI